MSRETFSLLAFSILAISGVSASYQWMKQHSTLDGQQALIQARPIIRQLSQEKHTTFKLAQITPPSNVNRNWRIELQNKGSQKIHILVRDNGHTQVIQ